MKISCNNLILFLFSGLVFSSTNDVGCCGCQHMPGCCILQTPHIDSSCRVVKFSTSSFRHPSNYQISKHVTWTSVWLSNFQAPHLDICLAVRTSSSSPRHLSNCQIFNLLTQTSVYLSDLQVSNLDSCLVVRLSSSSH